jgi:GTP cyclohydrolase I
MKKVAKFKPSAPSMEEAKEAVRTLIAWAGDDPEREGRRADNSWNSRRQKQIP